MATGYGLYCVTPPLILATMVKAYLSVIETISKFECLVSVIRFKATDQPMSLSTRTKFEYCNIISFVTGGATSNFKVEIFPLIFSKNIEPFIYL